ncbi:hypothetical protein EUZ85_19380 [Hahella sp. KA22]|uniref:MazG-like family protein n=1 Tax=Hahella sp. KA22 TaxID=1628392 RepID=UPI000FDE10F3|nr:MazG-like family protein [Hahella sp. KA22]AZZ92767.1 hypothetical protein ENC22_16800 [Hahella sp. KA22]QAY56141.1 hypothetical protein EUZ85_19380 [Hahella sp. KA22]
MTLKFDDLRKANIARLPHFKNAKGQLAHCENWTPADWLQALHGELGEYANLMKKVKRGDFAMSEVHEKLALELADAQTYLDLLAWSIGVDLGDITTRKWNEVSARIGYQGYLYKRESDGVVKFWTPGKGYW